MPLNCKTWEILKELENWIILQLTRVRQCRDIKIPLSALFVQAKAKYFAVVLGKHNLKPAPIGWVILETETTSPSSLYAAKI